MLDESRPRRSWTRVEKAAITAQVGVDGATLFDVAQSHGVGRYLLMSVLDVFSPFVLLENFPLSQL
ncbi:hypothetical protein [Pseudovibrio sp. Tun.PSC04-5.I4]|uniref:hypothetical protein n=1 Tax=Pseudovibrio sp. Tun.PSC04-5.I4 TaxID=1798213 RepID=UPI00087E8C42|nr:hypothetical protein [Pseudovibrio sp. Tun.PSC04-5.I4]SDR46956.1 hypothetical protein SAMN04515695_5703 [Pseudovibrio sp. Tun.PSC04-5.I4]